MAGWLVVTWDRPYREAIAAPIAAGVPGAFVVSRLPAERIVRSRYCELFLVTWSVVDVAIICPEANEARAVADRTLAALAERIGATAGADLYRRKQATRTG